MPADGASSLARPPTLSLGPGPADRAATAVPSNHGGHASRSPIPSPSPPVTGTASTTAAPVRRLPPCLQARTRASAACASCGAGSTTRSCSPATAARAGSASTRSRRSRSTTSCPASRCSRSGRPAATSPAASARTGTSRSRKQVDRWPTPHRRRRSPMPPRELGCASVAFTYNDPVIFVEYAVDTADGLPGAGHRARGRDGRLRPPRPPGASSTRHVDAANVDLKGFTEEFYRHVAMGDARAGARHPALPPARDRRVGRDHDAAHPRAQRLRRRAARHGGAGSSTELGPEVPLHFSAFHPDFKMLDVPPTPPATLHARPAHRPGRRACATSTRATSTTARATPPRARRAAPR